MENIKILKNEKKKSNIDQKITTFIVGSNKQNSSV